MDSVGELDFRKALEAVSAGGEPLVFTLEALTWWQEQMAEAWDLPVIRTPDQLVIYFSATHRVLGRGPEALERKLSRVIGDDKMPSLWELVKEGENRFALACSAWELLIICFPPLQADRMLAMIPSINARLVRGTITGDGLYNLCMFLLRR